MSGFNPRTHAGCDACAAAAAAPTPVSIHAPTQGATRPIAWCVPPLHVSIHAPTQGATPTLHHSRRRGVPMFQSTHSTQGATIPQHPGTCRPPFQSTHPRRVRRRAADRAIDRAGVSIHAPTQGATMGTVRLAAVGVSFNPRTHAGATRRRRLVRPHPARFNPRTHAGCDPGIARLAESVEDVSIHAPTQGATSPASPDRWFRWRFNPRTHAGCDRQHDDRRQDPRVSIHAPTQGAT